MKELTFVDPDHYRQRDISFGPPVDKTSVLSDMFRINTLSMIMEAGSGHIGTSFSVMDILTCLWCEVLENPNDMEAKHSDLFFSSKGHDVPALYSVMIGLGYLEPDRLHQLRDLGGLPGHPDIHTPHIITNTGSLGMGISKARGMALARRHSGRDGQIYVVTGDGELQEGQIWESLQPASNDNLGEITVIVDHNKLQSDIEVEHVSPLGNLEEKFASFGWHVFRVDGHDHEQLLKVFEQAMTVSDKPQVIIADTVKGKGSSITEADRHVDEDSLYGFHSGAPEPEVYQQIVDRLQKKLNRKLSTIELPGLETSTTRLSSSDAGSNDPENLIDAYGDELVQLGEKIEDLFVLDGDLMLDTGIIPFKREYPDRFIECGIAEQDMVSVAGGLALSGKLPVVHSFACFLSTRPNEQIYNNATEETKIIYAGSLAGVLPAGPGHSHQSVRDISALGSVPNLIMVQPANERETKAALRWAAEEPERSSYLRLVTIPVDTCFSLPEQYELTEGRGTFLKEGKDAILFAYGPVLLNEAVRAARTLKEEGIDIAVVNFPWLNSIDKTWLQDVTGPYSDVFCVDDHYQTLGLGQQIGASLNNPIHSFGLREVPKCGDNQDVLEAHQLDHTSITNRIRSVIQN